LAGAVISHVLPLQLPFALAHDDGVQPGGAASGLASPRGPSPVMAPSKVASMPESPGDNEPCSNVQFETTAAIDASATATRTPLIRG